MIKNDTIFAMEHEQRDEGEPGEEAHNGESSLEHGRNASARTGFGKAKESPSSGRGTEDENPTPFPAHSANRPWNHQTEGFPLNSPTK